MKKIVLSSLIILLGCQVYAQSFNEYLNEGKLFYNKNEYFTALERFDLAYEFAKSEKEKNETRTWKKKSRNKVMEQQDNLKAALKLVKAEKEKSETLMKEAIQHKQIAEAEKEKAQVALLKAQKMQKQMETAVFDRAAQVTIPGWKGAAIELFETNYEKIKKLNFAASGLSRLPSEVLLCPNLESLILIGNRTEDWSGTFNSLGKLTHLKDIQISLGLLEQFPEKDKDKITGVQIQSQFLSKLPDKIFEFTSLTYLNLRGTWQQPMMYEARDIVMTDEEKKMRSLSPQIGNLKNLEILDLQGNGLTKLPEEISQLKKLKKLLLFQNDFSDTEKHRIKQLLPNCEIRF